MADTDAFMWITAGAKPDVVGETTDDEMKKKKAFELLSWSFGATNFQSIGSGAHGAGVAKGEYTPFSIVKIVETASMALFQHALAGTHFTEAEVLIRRAGGTEQKQIPWITLKMQKVFISNFSLSGGGGQISESITFDCGAMEIKYHPQDGKGGVGTPVPAVWSKITNKPELKVS